MDTSTLNKFNQTISNIKFPEPYIPDYEDTVCGKMDRLQENIEKSNFTQESQLLELERIRYENKKLNAQINTLNKLADEQHDDISELKSELSLTQKQLQDFKSQYETANNGSFIKGIIIGFIPSLIIFILTIMATHYGFL